jgi:hypothetical protein
MDDLEVRDLFAMMAMCGDLAGRDNEADVEEYTYDVVANRAYSMADAMIEAREDKKIGLPSIKRRRK